MGRGVGARSLRERLDVGGAIALITEFLLFHNYIMNNLPPLAQEGKGLRAAATELAERCSGVHVWPSPGG